MSFEEWFEENLGEYAEEIARNGVVVGLPELTYRRDILRIYEEFEDDICAMVDMEDIIFRYAGTEDKMKNMLVWYAIEQLARKQRNE